MTFGYQLICRPAITFLYRAPMIELNPLNTRAMADNYVENIKPNEEKVLDARVSRDEFAKDAESMRLSILGKDTKVKEDKPLEVVDAYVRENTTELVDPLDVQKKVAKLKEKRDTLLTELDTQIKVSNATTFIEI